MVAALETVGCRVGDAVRTLLYSARRVTLGVTVVGVVVFAFGSLAKVQASGAVPASPWSSAQAIGTSSGGGLPVASFDSNGQGLLAWAANSGTSEAMISSPDDTARPATVLSRLTVFTRRSSPCRRMGLS